VKLIVGLGNPGNVYKNTRHNVGFRVARAIAAAHKVEFKKGLGTFALQAKVRLGDVAVVVALPMTFMNLSGKAVKALLKHHALTTDDLLVVYDDLDLAFGKIRIRPEGSSAGHKGIASIIEALGSNQFARLRLGIGRPAGGADVSEYVLAPFSKEEKREMEEIIERACACCEAWVTEGIKASRETFTTGSVKEMKQHE
jgi:PTH1 family peptidyl-tRNA hydrolase